MNILCNICYFVIRKCDCIGVYLVAIQSKSFKNVMAIEQNKVKLNTLCNICYFVIRKCDCIGVYLVAIQSKSFKNVMAIEQNKVKWTFCARFAILLWESVIALVFIWLQFRANHSRMWWQLNRIKWNEHFVQDLLFCYEKVWLHWCVFGCNSKQIIQECDGNWTE